MAAAHRARRPLRVLLGLPLLRTYHLWINRHDDLIADPRWRPFRAFYDRVLPYHRALAAFLLAVGSIGAAGLLGRRRSRASGAVLSLTLAARTLVLAWTCHLEPRYLAEVTPIAWVLFGFGAIEIARSITALERRLRLQG